MSERHKGNLGFNETWVIASKLYFKNCSKKYMYVQKIENIRNAYYCALNLINISQHILCCCKELSIWLGTTTLMQQYHFYFCCDQNLQILFVCDQAYYFCKPFMIFCLIRSACVPSREPRRLCTIQQKSYLVKDKMLTPLTKPSLLYCTNLRKSLYV